MGKYFIKIGKIRAKIHEIGKIKAIFGLGMTPIYGLKNGQIKSLTVQTEEAVLSGFFPVCYSDKNFVNSSPEKPLFYLRIETNSADPNQTASEEAV